MVECEKLVLRWSYGGGMEKEWQNRPKKIMLFPFSLHEKTYFSLLRNGFIRQNLAVWRKSSTFV